MLQQKAETYTEKKEYSKETAYRNVYGAYRPGRSREEVADYYSSWADEYEVDLPLEKYPGPIMCCNVVSECFPANNEDREKVKILDIACGSGTLGELLRKQGFSNIDGLDPSDGMLNLARKKNCYNNLYCEFLTSDVPIQKDTYDCAAVVGGLGEGHIPCESLRVMANIVKPGGYVVIAMRLEYMLHVEEYKDRLEPFMQQMEDQGIWVKESRTIVPRFCFDNDGIVFKFRVC